MDSFIEARTDTALTREISARYRVDISGMDQACLRVHKERLTLCPRSVMGSPRDDVLLVHEIDGNSMWVPRQYGMQHWGADASVRDDTTHGAQMSPAARFAATLKHEQVDVVRQAMDHLLPDAGRPTGAVLNLYCGFGKTVVALHIARQIGRRTIVLVHTTMLLTQWVERVRQFLGVEAGVIQRDRVDHDHDVVVGMLPSFHAREYDAAVIDSFGLVIVDEAHHVPAATYFRTVSKFRPRHVLGLTATPHRADGLTQLLYWTIGPCVCSLEREVNSDVRIECITYHGKSREILTRDGKPLLACMVTTLALSRARNEMLTAVIVQKARQGRRIIVLSDRVKQLHWLRERLATEGVATGTCIAVTNAHDREAARSATVLLTTWCMSREGLDIPELDTLVMASPKSDVVQAIGRILREAPGKKPPHVVDVCDGFSLFLNLQRKRAAYYRKQGFAVSQRSYELNSPGPLLASTTSSRSGVGGGDEV